jgi:hypothetical protein
VKYLTILVFTMTLCGRAKGQLDLYNSEGKKIGECTAGYEWHLYGAKYSVDWLLNGCAQKVIEGGTQVATVSTPPILQKDYSFPEPKLGAHWTKKSSWEAFHSDLITEK